MVLNFVSHYNFVDMEGEEGRNFIRWEGSFIPNIIIQPDTIISVISLGDYTIKLYIEIDIREL